MSKAYVILVEWLAGLATISDPRQLLAPGEDPCSNGTLLQQYKDPFRHHRLLPFNEEGDFEVSEADVVSCVRGNCQKPILEDGQPIKRQGPAKLSFADMRGRLAGMACHLCSGRLTGPAVETDRDGNVVFAGGYVNGVRAGLCWLVNPAYSSALVAEVNESGDFTGDDVALVFLDRRAKRVFAFVGRFENGIMIDAVRMGVKASEEGDSPFSIKRLRYFPLVNADDEGMRYHFKPGDHLRDDQERILAQAAWLWNYIQVLRQPVRHVRPTPLGPVIDGKSLIYDTAGGEPRRGMSTTRVWRDSPCRMCRKMESLMSGEYGQYDNTVWFACYPGAGSKIIMTYVSMPTGHSIRGPPEVDTKNPMSGSIMAKTHHQSADSWYIGSIKHYYSVWLRRPHNLGWRTWNLSQSLGRAIVLIRNPYRTLLSHWNHERTGGYNGNATLHKLENTTKSDLFRDFIFREVRLWEEIYLDFITMGSEVLVIHNELFFTDILGHTMRMLHFLGLNPSPQRMLCALWFPKETTKRRRKAFKESPFTDEMHEAVEAAMDRLDRALRERGHEPLPIERYQWARKKTVK